MFTMRRLLSALALILAPVVCPSLAAATVLEHTWVASNGNDSANCDRLTPCATFAQAYTNTSTGGEITCADSGDFGGLAFTPIAHSITINCEDTVGTVTTNNGTAGILISVGATEAVTLKGLDIDGFGSGALGCSGSQMLIEGAGTVHLQKLKLNHLLGGCNGIAFTPTGTATLDIVDSNITDNGSTGTGAGLYIKPASGVQANVTISRTQVQGNFFGILADGTGGGIVRGVIKDSVVSGNTENGITVRTTSSNVWLVVDETAVSGNTYGLVAGGSGAIILARNTTVFNNTTGLFTGNGGVIDSYGNNSVNGNTTNGAFTGTVGLQ